MIKCRTDTLDTIRNHLSNSFREHEIIERAGRVQQGGVLRDSRSGSVTSVARVAPSALLEGDLLYPHSYKYFGSLTVYNAQMVFQFKLIFLYEQYTRLSLQLKITHNSPGTRLEK